MNNFQKIYKKIINKIIWKYYQINPTNNHKNL